MHSGEDDDYGSWDNISGLGWLGLSALSFEMSLLVISWIPSILIIFDFSPLSSSVDYDYDDIY